MPTSVVCGTRLGHLRHMPHTLEDSKAKYEVLMSIYRYPFGGILHSSYVTTTIVNILRS